MVDWLLIWQVFGVGVDALSTLCLVPFPQPVLCELHRLDTLVDVLNLHDVFHGHFAGHDAMVHIMLEINPVQMIQPPPIGVTYRHSMFVVEPALRVSVDGGWSCTHHDKITVRPD